VIKQRSRSHFCPTAVSRNLIGLDGLRIGENAIADHVFDARDQRPVVLAMPTVGADSRRDILSDIEFIHAIHGQGDEFVSLLQSRITKFAWVSAFSHGSPAWFISLLRSE
jgi:hypothetical protein